MKRPPPRILRPEETKLWSVVAATVRPAHGRGGAVVVADPTPLLVPAQEITAAKTPLRFAGRLKPKGPPPRTKTAPPAEPPPPSGIEPNRHRRLVRERDPIERRIDLHGLDQDAARSALLAFLMRAQAEGERAVLVITGKGTRGDGVLRRRAPEWLADPRLRGVVAGVSIADRRHGGDGALYVALKRPA